MELGECADELVCVLTRSAKIFYYKWEDVMEWVSPTFAKGGFVCCVSITTGSLVKGVGVA